MENNNDKSNLNLKKSSFWASVILILFLVLAFVLIWLKIKTAQNSLHEHLRSKRDALQEVLDNIEKAEQDKQILLWYKNFAKMLLRVLFVLMLIIINVMYISHYYPKALSNIPEILGAITDLNAILLLGLSTFVFLIFGSFMELNKLYDIIQDRILQVFFNKKAEVIDAILRTNLNNIDALKDEIKATEDAIAANDGLVGRFNDI